ncbi:MAG TPA: DUF2786 domain-containing protein, partial [Nannocystis exedens]|nr:DUF2786 domain-containing protein [Nannocystis exedens]
MRLGGRPLVAPLATSSATLSAHGVVGRVEYAKVLDRVVKLLRMARGQANQHESAVAAAMAERLMREYQIEQYEFVRVELEGGRGLGCEETGTWRRCPEWQGLIAVATARLFDCQVD